MSADDAPLRKEDEGVVETRPSRHFSLVHVIFWLALSMPLWAIIALLLGVMIRVCGAMYEWGYDLFGWA